MLNVPGEWVDDEAQQPLPIEYHAPRPIVTTDNSRKLGFRSVRQRGSHIQFRYLDGRGTTVPDHRVPDHGGRDISPSLLRKIAPDIGMSVEDFVAAR